MAPKATTPAIDYTIEPDYPNTKVEVLRAYVRHFGLTPTSMKLRDHLIQALQNHYNSATSTTTAGATTTAAPTTTATATTTAAAPTTTTTAAAPTTTATGATPPPPPAKRATSPTAPQPATPPAKKSKIFSNDTHFRLKALLQHVSLHILEVEAEKVEELKGLSEAFEEVERVLEEVLDEEWDGKMKRKLDLWLGLELDL
ncbi:hypothetical protein SMMN14_03146 [Sphaerulina musiva]